MWTPPTDDKIISWVAYHEPWCSLDLIENTPQKPAGVFKSAIDRLVDEGKLVWREVQGEQFLFIVRSPKAVVFEL